MRIAVLAALLCAVPPLAAQATLAELQARFPIPTAVYTHFDQKIVQEPKEFLKGFPGHSEACHSTMLFLKPGNGQQSVRVWVPKTCTLDENWVTWTVPGGKPQTVTTEKFESKTLSGDLVYSYQLPPVPAGTVLERFYSETYPDYLTGQKSRALPNDAPVLAWHLDLELPVIMTYKLKNPLLEAGGSQLTACIDKDKHTRVLSLDAPDPGPQAPVPYPPWAPKATSVKWVTPWYRIILLSPTATVAGFYNRVANRDSMFSNRVEETTARLTQGLTTPKAKLDALYAFVQKDLKQIASSEETGGLFGKGAFNFAEMLEHHEGSADAIAALLALMLEKSGIATRLALVHQGVNEGFDPDWIDRDEPFKLMLAVELDGAQRWLFPQDLKRPMGQLDPWEMNRPAVVVQDKKTLEVIRTPAALPVENRYDETWVLELDDQGNGRTRFTRVGSGPEAQALRQYWDRKRPAERKNLDDIRALTAAAPLGQVIGGSVEQAPDPAPAFRTQLELDLKKVCQTRNGALELAPWASCFLIGQGFMVPYQGPARTQPIWVPYDQVVHRTLIIRAGGKRHLVGALPALARVVNALGTATSSYGMDQGDLRIEQTLTLNHGLHPKEFDSALRALAGPGSPLVLPALQFR
jgi:hypothetical protein